MFFTLACSPRAGWDRVCPGRWGGAHTAEQSVQLSGETPCGVRAAEIVQVVAHQTRVVVNLEATESLRVSLGLRLPVRTVAAGDPGAGGVRSHVPIDCPSPVLVGIQPPPSSHVPIVGGVHLHGAGLIGRGMVHAFRVARAPLVLDPPVQERGGDLAEQGAVDDGVAHILQELDAVAGGGAVRRLGDCERSGFFSPSAAMAGTPSSPTALYFVMASSNTDVRYSSESSSLV